jgi:hypothetical protein
MGSCRPQGQWPGLDYRAALAFYHFRYPHRHRVHLAMDFPLAGERYGLTLFR